MYILGISAYYHDSAAALIKDGEILYAAQEERFTRKKHDPSFPEKAIEFCLQSAQITKDDLEGVVFYDKPFLKFERLLETYYTTVPKGFKSFLQAMPVWIKEKLRLREDIRKKLSYQGSLYFTEHHMSHAASAYYPSPFEEAVIVTADGVGEWCTTSIGVGRGNDLKLIKEIHFPHSLGLLYSAFTYYTGFKVNSGEYKVMGLAPYGEGVYTQKILDHLIDVKEDGSFRLDMSYFNYMSGLTMTTEKFHRLFDGPPRKPETPLSQREMNIAKSIQEVTEHVMDRLVRFAMKETGINQVCLAGGVALNCVSNGKLVKNLPIKQCFIQPSSGDAGGALGAALFTWHKVLGKERPSTSKPDRQKGSFLGPRFDETEIQSYLDSIQAPYTKLASSTKYQDIASQLNDGKVVGLFQGAMEFGPRALGGRSILGDPRNPEMQKTMNLKIKYRESFRPFAPILLEEERERFFDLPCASPYMLMVGSVKESERIPMTEKDKSLFGIDKLNIPRSNIPAITHVDYSARLQTVTESENPYCYNLLKEFKKLTDIGILINTSFNVRGEPIVCTPQDAYRCFMRTEMDILVLEDFILYKKDQPQQNEDESWKEEFELD